MIKIDGIDPKMIANNLIPFDIAVPLKSKRVL